MAQSDRSAARTPRLALLFRGARTRWALPAASVREVAEQALPTSDGNAAAPQGGLAIEDFGALLGEPTAPSQRRVVLVLDSQPPRALAVEAVEGVVDLDAAQFFALPALLPPAVLAFARGALLIGERLALELSPALPAAAAPAADAPPGALPEPTGTPAPPGRALVFAAGSGELYGLPLPLVTSVLKGGEACHVPLTGRGELGLILHDRCLLPLLDLAAVRAGVATPFALAVALEAGGNAVALAASAVVGVQQDFADPVPAPGGWRWRAGGKEVFFPDVERWLRAAA